MRGMLARIAAPSARAGRSHRPARARERSPNRSRRRCRRHERRPFHTCATLLGTLWTPLNDMCNMWQMWLSCGPCNAPHRSEEASWPAGSGRSSPPWSHPSATITGPPWPGRARSAPLYERGSDSLVIAGSTGESPTLTHREKLDLFEAVIDVAKGKGKVLCGTGTYNTAETLELSREAEELV